MASLIILLSCVYSIINHTVSQPVSCNGGTCSCPSNVPSGTTCILDCDSEDSCKEQTLNCRDGDPCEIRCTSKSSCAAGTTINALKSTDVTLLCSAEDSCKDEINVKCGIGHCLLQCTHNKACLSFGNIYVSDSSSFQCIGGNNCPNNLPNEFTASPTLYPTISPTSPTNNPTNIPTNTPTLITVFPTQITQYPTLPSNNPTDSPTKFPSKSPSDSPTKFPTKSPTFRPTKSPTNDDVSNTYVSMGNENENENENEDAEDPLNVVNNNQYIFDPIQILIPLLIIGVCYVLAAFICWIYSVKLNKKQMMELHQKRMDIIKKYGNNNNNNENNNDLEYQDADAENQQYAEDLNVLTETDFNMVNNGEINKNNIINVSHPIQKQETAQTNISIPPPPPIQQPIQQPNTPITPYTQSNGIDMYNYLYLLQQQAYYNYYYRNGYHSPYASPYASPYVNQNINNNNNNNVSPYGNVNNNNNNKPISSNLYRSVNNDNNNSDLSSITVTDNSDSDSDDSKEDILDKNKNNNNNNKSVKSPNSDDDISINHHKMQTIINKSARQNNEINEK